MIRSPGRVIKYTFSVLKISELIVRVNGEMESILEAIVFKEQVVYLFFIYCPLVETHLILLRYP